MTKASVDAIRLARGLDALRARLEWLKEDGVRTMALLAETKELLSEAPVRRAPPPRTGTTPPAPPPPRPPARPTLEGTAWSRAATPAFMPAGIPAPKPTASGPVAVEMQKIADEAAACRKCRLCDSRTRVVPGQGNFAPELMFIGEGPGAEEDAQGLAFVGRAGQLLTKMIEAMGFTRDEVFIGNIVKCRPPENRTPLPDEMAACIPYLERQIELLKPKIIVALGGTAMKGLFNDPKISITKVRGSWTSYRGIDVMPTFHPAYVLRNPPSKREVWEDLKEVLRKLGRSPAKGR